MARLFSTMLEYKRPTPTSKYHGEGARAICVSNQSLLPSPLAQTKTPSKTASSLLDFLISCHKEQEVEPWTVFNITSEEIQTVWSMLESVSSGVSSGATVGVRHKAVPRSSRIGLSGSGEQMPSI